MQFIKWIFPITPPLKQRAGVVHSNLYFINAVNIVQHKFQIVEVSWNEENGASWLNEWNNKIQLRGEKMHHNEID